MPEETSRRGTPREEWEVLARSVSAGYLRRWKLHDPSGPVIAERPGSRTSRQQAPRRAERAAVR